MKRIFAFMIAILCAGMLLASCGGEPATTQEQLHLPPLERDAVKAVTASDAIFSSYLYVVEDASALDELTELYNGLTYAPLSEGEEAPQLLSDKLYSLTFLGEGGGDHDYGDPVASVQISPKGYVLLWDEASEAGSTAYRLTSPFDEERLKTLLRENDLTQQLQPTFG